MAVYWFRPKQYGYGATPVTWQGWAVTLASMAVVAASTVTIVTHTASEAWFWGAIAIDVLAIGALVAIGRRKTEGEWRWRWGDR